MCFCDQKEKCPFLFHFDFLLRGVYLRGLSAARKHQLHSLVLVQYSTGSRTVHGDLSRSTAMIQLVIAGNLMPLRVTASLGYDTSY